MVKPKKMKEEIEIEELVSQEIEKLAVNLFQFFFFGLAKRIKLFLDVFLFIFSGSSHFILNFVITFFMNLSLFFFYISLSCN